MAKQREITQVERVTAMEARVGVRLAGLFATIREDGPGSWYVEVTGEAHAVGGEALGGDVELVASAYDAEGRVVATDTGRILSAKKFYGFDTFSVLVKTPASAARSIIMVRVYPRPY